MNFRCQQETISEMMNFASSDKHSILIEGTEGSGKSYLAKQYSKLINADDFAVVVPTVNAIREALDNCQKLSTRIVLCIENLDCGVPAASYTLLKFLEEPNTNVYIVITCRNIKRLPDTIISRSVVTHTSTPTDDDIVEYAEKSNFSAYSDIRNSAVWSCVRTFSDVDMSLKLNRDQISYFDSIASDLNFNDTISSLSWRLSHYPDNTEAPVAMVIRCIFCFTKDQFIKRTCIDCLRDLSYGRIASNAIIAKFLFTCKYCE